MKAEGVFVRTHAKWMEEEEEKITAYFCRLEKRRQESNAVHSLFINDEVITDPIVTFTLHTLKKFGKEFS